MTDIPSFCDNQTKILKELSQIEGFSDKHFDSKVLKQLGFTDFVDHDEMFYLATLPNGWTVKQDGRNPYLSLFMDALGRKRLYQIYKGAVYGHQRDLRVNHRFLALVVRKSDKGSYNNYKVGEDHIGIVIDSGASTDEWAIIWQSEPLKLSEDKPWFESKALRKLAEDWLDLNYPKYKDPFAYWN
jgi:hypothetical protein